MKNYTVTVNGNVYDVTVEENGTSGITPVHQAGNATPVSVPNASNHAGTAGSIKVEAGASGKVFKIEKTIGSPVKRGEPILVLEVMKMETPVVAPQDGTVASIDVTEGQAIEAGELLATMN